MSLPLIQTYEATCSRLTAQMRSLLGRLEFGMSCPFRGLRIDAEDRSEGPDLVFNHTAADSDLRRRLRTR